MSRKKYCRTRLCHTHSSCVKGFELAEYILAVKIIMLLHSWYCMCTSSINADFTNFDC